MSKLKFFAGLLLYKIAPIKKHRFVFTSLNGHYSDHPKYICNALHNEDTSIEMIWLTDEKYRSQLPSWVKWYDIHSLAAEWIRGSAKALVDNVYCEKAYTVFASEKHASFKSKIYCFLRDKRNQNAYTTFHGIGMKRIGRDQIGNDVIDFVCPHTTMFLGSDYAIHIMKHVTFNKMKMVLIGSPRNDILFQPSITSMLRNKLQLPQDKKILLYAPTFRNDGKDVEGKNVRRSGLEQLKQMDFERLFCSLSAKFGGDWVMVCRFHYHVAQMVDWEQLNIKYPGKFINGNLHDDMAEYLACTDILITDASTSSFDFALTGKPCFLFFPDYDEYCNNERGFYTPLEELPFPLSITFNELMVCIEQFDTVIYEKNIAAMLKQFNVVDDENSSKRIAKYLLEECK